MAVKSKYDQEYYIAFIIISFLFLLTEYSMVALGFLYTYGVIFGVISSSLFLAYLFLYFVKTEKTHKLALNIIFLVSLINFFSMLFLSGPVSDFIVRRDSLEMFVVGLNLFLFMSFALPLFLAILFIRRKKSISFAFIIITFVIMLIIFYFLSGSLLQSYTIDDEVFIALNGIKDLLHGVNPYAVSISEQLFNNRSVVGFSFTTYNEIIGVLNYPALYLFSYLPFYFIAQPNIYNFEHFIEPLQAMTFLLILLLVVGFSIDKRYLSAPIYGLIIFLAFEFVIIASLTTYLMLALLILAYKQTGNKYSWLFFGLSLAIQEQLWIPIILLWVYSINNYGIKKGFYDIALSTLVFLAINSYFLAIDPNAFITAVFNPLQKFIFPVGTSTFGYFLLTYYHIMLGSFSVIFGIIVLLSIVAYSYLNKKMLLGFFSMIPFLFLSHSLVAYYVFFVSFILVTMFIKEERNKAGIIEEYLRKRKILLYLATLVLCIAFVSVVYTSHLAYTKGFNLKVSDQSLHLDKNSSQSLYGAKLTYSNLSTNTIYIMFFGYYTNQVLPIGIGNYPIINNSVECADYRCLVNVNRIQLNNSNNTYTIKAHIPSYDADTPVKDVRLIIYDGQYLYSADSIANNNSK